MDKELQRIQELAGVILKEDEGKMYSHYTDFVHDMKTIHNILSSDRWNGWMSMMDQKHGTAAVPATNELAKSFVTLAGQVDKSGLLKQHADKYGSPAMPSANELAKSFEKYGVGLKQGAHAGDDAVAAGHATAPDAGAAGNLHAKNMGTNS